MNIRTNPEVLRGQLGPNDQVPAKVARRWLFKI